MTNTRIQKISFFLLKPESILLLLILFLPQKNFFLYYGTLLPVLSFLIVYNYKRVVFQKKALQIYLLWFMFLLIFILYKVFLYQNLFDIKELLKVFLFLMIYITTVSLEKIELEVLAKWLFVYIFIDFSISICQFMHIDLYIVELITNIYNADKHVNISLSYASARTLGLSPGPGQHGIFSLLIFMFFIVSSVFGVTKKYKYLGAILALSSLILSQSKTVILAFIISSIFLIIFIFLYKNNKYRLYLSIIFISICLLLVYNFETMLLMFEQFNRLRNVGLATSSVMQRFDMWYAMYQAILDSNTFYFLFGAGRSYLTYMDVHNSFFDSDYVYIFVNYGFIGFLTYLLYIFIFLTKNTFRFNKIPLLLKILYMMILSGSIIALSLSFIIDIKVLSLFAILYALKSKLKES